MSSRPRRARKKAKYSIDAFDGLQDVLQDSDASQALSSSDDADAERDEDFGQADLRNLAALEEADAQEEEELASQLDDEDASVRNDDPVSRGATPTSTAKLDRELRKERKPGRRTTQTDTEDLPRSSRGLSESFMTLASDHKVLMTVAQVKEELIPFVQVRDRWMEALSLPTRKSVKGKGGGLMHTPYFMFDDSKADRDWKWYHIPEGGSIAERLQIVQTASINTDDGSLSDLPDRAPAMKFIAGPVDEQRLHVLAGGQVCAVHQLFNKPSVKRDRNGWIINFGTQVQCLEWLQPNESTTQCLVVSPRTGLAGSRKAAPQNIAESLSSFAPQPGRQSQFYFYEFYATDSGESAEHMDMLRKPHLRAIISYEWNELRRLKFCPARQPSNSYKSPPQTIGPMAGIWLDGYVRVLDIKLPNTAETQVLHVTKAVFEARPPDTVCTAVTWLSASSIAVACANGSVAIWNLAHCVGATNPRPWFYKSFHESYILNIVSAYPSKPTFIFTNSIDGWLKMIDIRDPRADVVTAQRHRLAQLPLAWSDQCQCLLNASEMSMVSAHFLRFFHVANEINRLPAAVLDIATSSLHPHALVACTDGSVYSTNVTAKLRATRKPETNRQLWFKHEYRRAIKPHRPAAADSDVDMPDADAAASSASRTSQATPDEVAMEKILAEPLIRLTDGYKLENALLGTHKTSGRAGASQPVVYEPQTGVERVAWNPNLIAGTWAAAAMGSGMIRIEDIGVE